jgi:hypothetical protein
MATPLSVPSRVAAKSVIAANTGQQNGLTSTPLGLSLGEQSPPGAFLFDTTPVPFAIRSRFPTGG